MTIMRSICLVFMCVLVSMNMAWSSDITTLEYLLSAKLTSWRDNVTQLIKGEVLQEVLTTLEARTKTLRHKYQTIKISLRDTKYRITNLETENLLLKDMILNLKNNRQGCNPPTNTTVTCSGGNDVKLAIGEHRSGDIHLIDTNTGSRWKVTSCKGITGMVFHSVTKILYLVTADRTSAIHSVNVFLNTQQVLRKCPKQCLGIGLDAKENIVYFIESSRKARYWYVLKLYLNTSKMTKKPKPLLRYSRNLYPSTLTVDDIDKCVFVVLMGKGVIEQIDYTGKKVGELAVHPVVEATPFTFNMVLNKVNKILYYSTDVELYRRGVESEDGTELVGVSKSGKLSGLVFVNNQLLVSYVDNNRVDVWTEKGFKKIFDLHNSDNSDSKHICLFD